MKYEEIDIWNGFEYKSAAEGFRPVLAAYILDNKPSRGAILICPGGGYAGTSEREGEPIAFRFAAAGYHTFVLYYSVAPDKHPMPLRDVTRAMCIIRDNAKKWGINENKIAVMGFSAGAHLAGSLATLWNEEYLSDVPGMKPGKNRPNAAVLCYPVITGGEFREEGSFKNLTCGDEKLAEEMSLEKRVSADTPPTFLWHTVSDEIVPVENSLLFANALRKNNVPFEMHIYPEGPHGLATSDAETCQEDLCDAHVATWMDLCAQWLESVWGKAEYYK